MKYVKPVLAAITLIAALNAIAQEPDTSRWRKLSTMAASLLAQADVARQAVAHHDSTAAQNSIRQALTLTEMIQSAAPPADPLMVPIAIDFDSSEMLAPATKHASRLKKNADVAEVTGDYNATVLNVSVAREHLEEAQAALYRGDYAGAASDLTGVNSAVVNKTYNGELPLVQARDNLTLARSRVQAGDYKNAVLPLKAAARALDRFAQNHPGYPQGRRAEKINTDIEVYADLITKQHDDAIARITAWYDQVNDWFNSGMAQ